jgi:hypothetical protein
MSQAPSVETSELGEMSLLLTIINAMTGNAKSLSTCELTTDCFSDEK